MNDRFDASSDSASGFAPRAISLASRIETACCKSNIQTGAIAPQGRQTNLSTHIAMNENLEIQP